MEEQRLELRITPPSAKTQGYLKRQRDFFAAFSKFRNLEPEGIDALIDWMIQYCSFNAGWEEDAIREEFWRMSEDEFEALMKQISGSKEEEEKGKGGSVPTKRQSK